MIFTLTEKKEAIYSATFTKVNNLKEVTSN